MCIFWVRFKEIFTVSASVIFQDDSHTASSSGQAFAIPVFCGTAERDMLHRVYSLSFIGQHQQSVTKTVRSFNLICFAIHNYGALKYIKTLISTKNQFRHNYATKSIP